jgi:hypothetical protein
MESNSPTPSTAEVRLAIARYAVDDLLRVGAMWLVPLVFLFLNPWFRHWGTFLALGVVGVFVIGGTTLSLPAIALRSMPLECGDIWTPWRCAMFVALYLVLWSLTYVAMN